MVSQYLEQEMAQGSIPGVNSDFGLPVNPADIVMNG